MVGLAGLEPAASSLSAIEGSPLCGPAFSQVAANRQGRSNAFLATPSQAVQAGKAIPYSLAREADVEAADNTQHGKQQDHPPARWVGVERDQDRDRVHALVGDQHASLVPPRVPLQWAAVNADGHHPHAVTAIW
jgi:hypothetical protein